MSRLLAALLSTVAFLAASSLPITGVEGLPATGEFRVVHLELLTKLHATCMVAVYSASSPAASYNPSSLASSFTRVCAEHFQKKKYFFAMVVAAVPQLFSAGGKLSYGQVPKCPAALSCDNFHKGGLPLIIILGTPV